MEKLIILYDIHQGGQQVNEAFSDIICSVELFSNFDMLNNILECGITKHPVFEGSIFNSLTPTCNGSFFENCSSM